MKPRMIDSDRTVALQNEIDNYFNWAGKWKLFVNFKKCESMTITKNKIIVPNVIKLAVNQLNVYIVRKICQFIAGAMMTIVILTLTAKNQKKYHQNLNHPTSAVYNQR